MLFEVVPAYNETIKVRPLGSGPAGMGPPMPLSAGKVEAKLNKCRESFANRIFPWPNAPKQVENNAKVRISRRISFLYKVSVTLIILFPEILARLLGLTFRPFVVATAKRAPSALAASRGAPPRSHIANTDGSRLKRNRCNSSRGLSGAVTEPQGNQAKSNQRKT